MFSQRVQQHPPMQHDTNAHMPGQHPQQYANQVYEHGQFGMNHPYHCDKGASQKGKGKGKSSGKNPTQITQKGGGLTNTKAQAARGRDRCPTEGPLLASPTLLNYLFTPFSMFLNVCEFTHI